MAIAYVQPEFEVQRNEARCIACRVCERQCANEVHRFDEERAIMLSDGVLLSSMGNPNPLPVYWDRMLVGASQVTNPPIDPLREPMETRVFLGKKPDKIRRKTCRTRIVKLCGLLPVFRRLLLFFQ